MVSSGIRKPRLMFAAGAVFALSIAPAAIAGGAEDERAKASKAVSSKKFKKLKQQVALLQQQLDGVSKQPGPQGPPGEKGEQGASGLSTGPAGGDLSGSYPNPSIAANAVGSTEVIANSLSGADIDEGTLDNSILQARVGSSCSGGEAISAIAANGTVTCDPDDSGGAPSGPAGGDLAGSSYPNPDIAPNAVALGGDTTGNYVASVANGTGITGAGAAAEGATPTLGLDYSATLGGNPALGSGQSSFGSTGLIFEGATANTSESLVTPTDPTTDRTITLPNASGEASLLGQSISSSELDDDILVSSLQISGPAITRHESFVRTDVPSTSIGANDCGTYSVLTAGGTTAGDTVIATPDFSSSSDGIERNDLTWNAYLSGTASVAIRACNPTASNVNTADDQEWRIDVWEH